MNVRYPLAASHNEVPSAVPLSSPRGELITVSIVAEPRDLEDLLDRLGESQFPIDPQIYHDAHIEGRAVTLVEFAAYDSWMDEIEQLLGHHQAVTIRQCLTHAASN